MPASIKTQFAIMLGLTLNVCALTAIYELRRPPAFNCTPVKVTLQVGPAWDKIIPESEWDSGASFVVPCLVKGAKSATPPVVIPENHHVRMQAVYVDEK